MLLHNFTCSLNGLFIRVAWSKNYLYASQVGKLSSVKVWDVNSLFSGPLLTCSHDMCSLLQPGVIYFVQHCALEPVMGYT